MPGRIGINGFGRIGRCVVRRAAEASSLGIAAINDIAEAATLAHLLKYDSVHGRFPGEVTAEEAAIVARGERIAVTRQSDPDKIPWSQLGVDIVLECSGRFSGRADAGKHLVGGAKKVIVSAPGKDVDGTFCCGINLADYDTARHTVISNASCTTNGLAPVVKVLDEAFGIEHGLMTTVHSYTNDQRILDQPHRDLRRSRSAATNIIPTSTGAARAIGEVMPGLKGRLDGGSLRVPTDNVSLVDLTAQLRRPATREAVNQAFRAAATAGPLRGIMAVTDEQLVSSDFNGDPHSSTIDLEATMMSGDRLVKVLAWYDNEMGYSQRLLDLAAHVAARL